MRLSTSLPELGDDSAVAIGNFDGFHLGHQRIIDRLIEFSKKENLQAVILTFTPHPRIFFNQPVRLISTDLQRRETLSRQPADVLLFVPFAEVADMEVDGFITNVLLDRLRTRWLIVGHDFRFGRGRKGRIADLRRLSRRLPFLVSEVDPVRVDGQRVSSSLIRQLLLKGEIRQANRMLGGMYRIDGIVEKGAGRGRQMGFPTINLRSANQILPEGVFHTLVEHRGRRYASLTNIGYGPTFSRAEKKIETHILRFRQSIYGQKVRIFFCRKIRDETTFPTPEALAEQIGKDIAAASFDNGSRF